MINNITDAEQKSDSFSPLLKEIYPEGRINNSSLEALKDMYSQVSLPAHLVIGLYDHRLASLFYVSDNIMRLGGYEADTVTKWKLFLFKALHYSHYSFAFSTIRRIPPFYIKQPAAARMDIQLSCCGLKMVDASGEIRRVFIKNKTLLLDDKGVVDVSIFFLEEVTHLMKGEHYWYRLACQEDEFVYVHQKGKKNFSSLLSNRELEILRLIEQKKKTAEIADALFLSKLTVETHRKNMIQRTGAIDTTALLHLCKLAKIL